MSNFISHRRYVAHGLASSIRDRWFSPGCVPLSWRTKKVAKSKKEIAKLNETGLRKSSDRRTSGDSSKPPVKERRKVERRRQIDPTTCERDYTDAEVEFMRAMDEYKRKSGRMFPTCSEILEVLYGLGYQKVTQQEFAETI